METGEVNSNSIKLKEIRKFGLIAFVFLGCLAAVSIWRGNLVLKYFFGCLAIIGFGLLVTPRPLTPVYNGWIKITRTISRIFTIVVLSFAYYLVVTPTALIKRIFGGRPLPLKPDPNLSSYWVSRTEPVQPKERFSKRF